MVSRPNRPRIRRRRQIITLEAPYHLEEEKKECEPYDEERDDTMDTTISNIGTATHHHRMRRPILVPGRRGGAAAREVDVATILAQDALRMAIEARQAAERLRLFRSNLSAYRAAAALGQGAQDAAMNGTS